jgi:hypothetical protein
MVTRVTVHCTVRVLCLKGTDIVCPGTGGLTSPGMDSACDGFDPMAADASKSVPAACKAAIPVPCDATIASHSRRLLSSHSLTYSHSLAVAPINHSRCVEAYEGMEYPGLDPPASFVSKGQVCVIDKNSEMSAGTSTCITDSGLPLYTKMRGEDRMQLLGLAIETSEGGDKCSSNEVLPLPAIFTRVSPSLQWIRAAMGEPFVRHLGSKLGLDLRINELSLPVGSHLTVYHGVSIVDRQILGEEGKISYGQLDSKCQVPFTAHSSSGMSWFVGGRCSIMTSVCFVCMLVPGDVMMSFLQVQC